MNKCHIPTLLTHPFFGAGFPVCRLQTGGMGLLLAYEDYGFIFKMKMTKVSNPMQRKQKRRGMSSNPCDLKNIATLFKMQRVLSGDDMV